MSKFSGSSCGRFVGCILARATRWCPRMLHATSLSERYLCKCKWYDEAECSRTYLDTDLSALPSCSSYPYSYSLTTSFTSFLAFLSQCMPSTFFSFNSSAFISSSSNVLHEKCPHFLYIRAKLYQQVYITTDKIAS